MVRWLAGAALVLASPFAMGAQCEFTVEASWVHPMQPLSMRNQEEFYCFLIGASGNFRGSGESVFMRGNGFGRWVLGGTSQQEGVTAHGICAAKGCFTSASGGTARWHSEEITALSSADAPDFPWEHCWAGIHDQRPAWWGDAFTVLNGMQGRFDGLGEFVSVQQTSQPFEASRVNAKLSACTDDYLRASAHSFFVGTPSSGKPARFGGPGGFGNAAQVGEFTVSAAGTTMSTVMIPTWAGMCYFTEISGNFRGGGESVRITAQTINGVKRWVLKASHANPNGLVTARSRCVLFAQN
ncbi:hypothetical protein [Tahibacter amnicola]|uniref:Uncharacterized protein n=1 Tax=Tahibacter amnicola TaxID=2976241 RepID=A0ABY6BJH0_9GAMM|nr:hypothetical protein [Tahibacter amnicola]UXI70174.1 hypothetical protein N4264_11240 [Tahibacter amnicola]